jgi:glycosyltransferase involved in cell wall biosynthesis
MRILFAHDSPSSAAALLPRVQCLASFPGVEVETVFTNDPEERELFARCGPTSTADARGLREIITAMRYDALVLIDGSSYLDVFRELPAQGVAFIEAHSAEAIARIARARPSCDAVVVPSRAAKRALKELVPGHLAIEIAPIIVDPKVFFPTPSAKAPRPILGWVGELDDAASWRSLLLLGSLVVESGSDVEIWVAGGERASDATVEGFLESADALDLTARLRWFPRIDLRSRRRYYGIIAESGGALLSTSSGLFGLASTEALFCGCPVVAPDAGANGEIAPGSPFLRLFHQIEEAAYAVRALLDPAAPRMAESDVTEIRSRFGPETLGPLYLAMIVHSVEAKRLRRQNS